MTNHLSHPLSDNSECSFLIGNLINLYFQLHFHKNIKTIRCHLHSVLLTIYNLQCLHQTRNFVVISQLYGNVVWIRSLNRLKEIWQSSVDWYYCIFTSILIQNITKFRKDKRGRSWSVIIFFFFFLGDLCVQAIRAPTFEGKPFLIEARGKNIWNCVEDKSSYNETNTNIKRDIKNWVTNMEIRYCMFVTQCFRNICLTNETVKSCCNNGGVKQSGHSDKQALTLRL